MVLLHVPPRAIDALCAPLAPWRLLRGYQSINIWSGTVINHTVLGAQAQVYFVLFVWQKSQPPLSSAMTFRQQMQWVISCVHTHTQHAFLCLSVVPVSLSSVDWSVKLWVCTRVIVASSKDFSFQSSTDKAANLFLFHLSLSLFYCFCSFCFSGCHFCMSAQVIFINIFIFSADCTPPYISFF